MSKEIDAAFDKIFKTIKAATQPERNTEHLTLYPINRPIEPYVPKAAAGTLPDSPKYTPGKKKLTLKDYYKRRKQNTEAIKPKPTRGGRRNKLQQEIIGYRKLLQISTTDEEKNKYSKLIRRAKKEVNKIKRKNWK